VAGASVDGAGDVTAVIALILLRLSARRDHGVRAPPNPGSRVFDRLGGPARSLHGVSPLGTDRPRPLPGWGACYRQRPARMH
jgi:hypothetical protein